MNNLLNFNTSPKTNTVLRMAMLGVGFTMLMAAGAAHAGTQTFDFSFTGTGSTPGTVTGQIFGLPYNGVNVHATDVKVDSYSPATGAPAAPFDPYNLVENYFSVEDGVIYSIWYQASFGLTQLALNNSGVNQLYTYNGGDIQNNAGLNGLTLTNITQSAPVPELPVPLMLSLGMLAPVLARRLRKAAKPVATT
jgi:hypothetical protein